MLRRPSQSMPDAKRREAVPLVRRMSIDELDHLDTNVSSSSNQTPSRTVIALALLLTILGFTVQIEAIAYYQDVLGWPKPFFSLYLTHSSLSLPWLLHLLYLRAKQRRISTRTWLRRYIDDLAHSVISIEAFTHGSVTRSSSLAPTPFAFLTGSMLIVTAVLTVSGVSWFMALKYTTPGDLTAIYNCSAFFAAVFSVPLLRQRVGATTVVAVALSIMGTLIIAYGDIGSEEDDTSKIGVHRLFGNLVAVVGAVAFGLYSVLFKRWTDVKQARHSSSSFDLAIAASGLTGAYTFLIGWVGVLALHVLGVEQFVLPGADVAIWLVISIIGGAVSMTLLLLLVTWTTPVFGSVTSILSVFFVAIADWLLFGLVPSVATYVGGSLIFLAFGLLARDETSNDR